MFLPYIYLIPYPDCVGRASLRELDTASELMALLAVCRHGLHQGALGFMIGCQGLQFSVYLLAG